MVVLGAGVIAVASTGDMKLWAMYVSVVAIGAKVAAFAVQYVALRILVTNRIRTAPELQARLKAEGILAR
jgi:hypothetical protein